MRTKRAVEKVGERGGRWVSQNREGVRDDRNREGTGTELGRDT